MSHVYFSNDNTALHSEPAETVVAYTADTNRPLTAKDVAERQKRAARRDEPRPGKWVLIIRRSTPRLGQVLKVKDGIVHANVLNTTASRNTGKDHWLKTCDTFSVENSSCDNYYLLLTPAQADRAKRGAISLSKLRQQIEGEE